MGELEQAVDLVGTTIGAYRVGAVLGRGGMGAVYRAEQAPVGRLVALKVIHDELAQDPAVAARFLREAKIACSLRNPNTITVYEFGQSTDGRLFMAMELLDGESVATRIKRAGPLEVSEALEIAQQVCRSLAEAHAKAIVHRDLKSDNVFMTMADDGSLLVKVLDYGIAHAGTLSAAAASSPGTLTKHGTLLGTPAYMAPEQARAEPVDGRADLWALGVVLYEMLTGVQPFRGDNAVVVLGKLLSEPPPPMAKVGRRIRFPEAVEALVDALLSKDRDERPATALSVQSRLREIADGTTPAGAASGAAPPMASTMDTAASSWGLPLELATPPPAAALQTMVTAPGTPPASAARIAAGPIPTTRGATPSPVGPAASGDKPVSTPAPTRSPAPPSVGLELSDDPFDRDLSSAGSLELDVDRGPRSSPDVPLAVARRSSIPPRPRVSRPPPPPPRSGGAGVIALVGLLAAGGAVAWLTLKPKLPFRLGTDQPAALADLRPAEMIEPTSAADGGLTRQTPATQAALAREEERLRAAGWEATQLLPGGWAGTYDIEGGTLRLFDEGGRVNGSFEQALRAGGIQGTVQPDGSLEFSWRASGAGAVRGTEARTGQGVLRAWTQRRDHKLVGTWGYGESRDGALWVATPRVERPTKRPQRR